MAKIQMTEREKEIVTELNHELYTVEYLEHWLNRNDSVALNASAAMQAMGAHGFYEAVKCMAAGSSHTAEWIPCNERLPENNHSVLVYLESRTIRGGHIHSIGGYQNNVWFIRSGVETESYPNHEWNVIAWMPLPKPYKEAEACKKFRCPYSSCKNTRSCNGSKCPFHVCTMCVNSECEQCPNNVERLKEGVMNI